ncbi:MAG: VOC family protein [Rudaea sp.]
MIGYVTLGTTNLPRAVAFYDDLLGILGAKRGMQSDRYVIWSIAPDKPGLGVIVPFNGSPASVGNGTMVALAASSRDQVDAIHRKALELGGSDEGAPGLRGETFYTGYFRDLDGNKVSAFLAG